MTDDRPGPQLSREGASRAEARQDRLARALRQNLARRKAQQRARQGGEGADSDASSAAPSAPVPAAGDRAAES